MADETNVREFKAPEPVMPSVPTFGAKRDWVVTEHMESLVLGDRVRGARISELTFSCPRGYHDRASDGSFSIYVMLLVYDSSGREQGRWGGDFFAVTSLDEARAKAVAWAQNIVGSVARDLNLAAAPPAGDDPRR
jgi:hypothetical protein